METIGISSPALHISPFVSRGFVVGSKGEESERVLAGNESSLAFFERGAERSFRGREKVSLLLLAFASSARVDPLTASSTVETRNSRPIFLFIRRKICKTEEKPT